MMRDAQLSGAEVRRQVFGDGPKASGDPFMAPFFEVAVEHVWGGLWNRPGLDLKYRSLVVAAAAVLAGTGGHEDELRTHLRGALNLGWTASTRSGHAARFVNTGGLRLHHVEVRVNVKA